MDPDQTVRDINSKLDEWLSSDTASALNKLMNALSEWLDRGGFPPSESMAQAATFKRYLSLRKRVSRLTAGRYDND